MKKLSDYDVPEGSQKGGIVQQKVKYRFRVMFDGLGDTHGLNLTRQVVSCDRPSVEMGLNTPPRWMPIEVVLRDDIKNGVSRAISTQIQRQMRWYETQTQPDNPVANYKFDLSIETIGLDGDELVDRWVLKGCFISEADYNSFDYSAAEPMSVGVKIMYDTAIQEFPRTVWLSD